MQVLMDKKADAIVAWTNFQIPPLEVKGYQLNRIMLSDFGINNMSLVVIAHKKTIDNNPGLCKRFVAALAKSWDYTRAHPEESITILRKQFPNLDAQIALKQLLETFRLAQTPNTVGKPTGWMALKDWEDTQELLIKFAGMKAKIEPATVFTNQFIP
jgi:NitT/TauT family transport system substrate-binding protein